MHLRTLPQETASATSAAALPSAIVTELGGALAALRATLEALGRDIGVGDPRCERVQRGIRATIHAARWVDALVDVTLPSELRPLSCSLDEIAQATRRGARCVDTTRLTLAVEDHGAAFVVDGPVLVRSLVRFAESLLADERAQLLLRAQMRAGEVCFTFVGDAHAALPPEVERLLVRHDAERLGGTYWESGQGRYEIRFRARSAEEAA